MRDNEVQMLSILYIAIRVITLYRGIMSRNHVFVATLFLLSLGSASADSGQICNDHIISTVANWAKIDPQTHPVVAEACKIMPDKPDTTIAVMAFDENGVPAEEGGSKRQVIALIKDGRVLAAKQVEIDEDASRAVGESSFTIDTARYHLSPTTRAFGIIFNNSARGPSCPDFNADRELTLWILEGSQLRAVFGTNLYGWINLDSNFCDKEMAQADMTVSLEKTQSHGFADLLLTAHVIKTGTVAGEYTKLKERVVRKKYHYNGRSYGFHMFNEFWYQQK